MKETKTYQAMLERYPDSIISLRNHGPFNSDMEIIAYSNSSESHLDAHIGFDHQNDFTWEHVRCQVGDGDSHKKLGTTPPELIDNNRLFLNTCLKKEMQITRLHLILLNLQIVWI